MFCPKCGTRNDDNHRFCKNCGEVMTFVPGQDVPHHFKPYSIEEKKTQEMKALKALTNPFDVEDDVPEEKPVKLAPDPFAESAPMPENFQEEIVDAPAHWGKRIFSLLLIVTVLVLVLTNMFERISGVKIMETLYRQIEHLGRMRGEDLAEWICSMVFYNFLVLFGVIGSLKLLIRRFKITGSIVMLLVAGICGIVAMKMGKGDLDQPIILTVASVVLLAVNSKLPGKNDSELDGIEIPEDAPNPLL